VHADACKYVQMRADACKCVKWLACTCVQCHGLFSLPVRDVHDMERICERMRARRISFGFGFGKMKEMGSESRKEQGK